MNVIEKTILIPHGTHYARLDQALAQLLPDYSRTQIKAWIEQGAVLVNGRPCKAKQKLHGGEEITLNAQLKPQPVFEAQALELNIVHEDEAVLVINKPAGLVVHPGAGNKDRTLLNALLFHAPALKDLPRAGILHRLDKDTSGLLVIAKSAPALKDLGQQLRERSMVREYQAIACGQLISGGKVDAPIGRAALNRKRMAVSDSGKSAITHYRVQERFRAHTLLSVKLQTGRTHQIRVHMTHIHHPLVGDKTYGGRLQIAKGSSPELITALRHFPRQALHAARLAFTHPVTRDVVSFTAELPADMQQLLQILREDKSK